jgi:ABC-2 type transport system ATP-binding protein
MAAAIRARGLVKKYGDVVALDGLDLDVEEGTVMGLLGPNGAGKTTTVRVLTTLLKPDAGTAEVAGVDVLRRPKELRRRIGVSGQYAAVDEHLTGFENLDMVGRLYHLGAEPSRVRARELLEQFDLVEAADRTVKGYSGGMRRRLDLAGALVARPPVIFLDEPTTGLDPQARLAVWNALDRLRRRGVTLLLTTHYMEEAERLCDRLVIMDEGRIVTDGRPPDLVRSHVGREVLELKLDADCDAERLVGSLDGRIQGHDLSERTLMLYAEDAEAVLEGLDHDVFPTESALVRRATLEDVFLRLTGRSLRE